jgi:hypothetical protein
VRFDWLKPRAIVDPKERANIRERPISVAIRMAVAE